jgi:predicted transcriptional regulator
MPKMAKSTPYMRGQRAATTIYLRPEVLRALQKFSASTDSPVAHHLRRAVDEYLERHGVAAPKLKGTR